MTNKKEPKKHKIGCRLCGRKDGVTKKYGLNMCRQCFKSKAAEMGFKKYN